MRLTLARIVQQPTRSVVAAGCCKKGKNRKCREALQGHRHVLLPQDVDADALQKTVDEYNEAADSGVDPRFHKPAKYIHAIRKAPFYALKMCPVVVCSCGGINVNRDMQVVGYDEEPVCAGNLFAVGNDASGLYGDAYTIDVPGSTNGFAHTSGRIAARKAIEILKG